MTKRASPKRTATGGRGICSVALRRGFQSLLDQRALLKFATLIDPTTVLGANLVPVPEAGVGLQHECWIGLQNHPFGFLFCIVQSGTGQLNAEDPHTVFVLLHCPNEVLHPLSPSVAHGTPTDALLRGEFLNGVAECHASQRNGGDRQTY
jgi:hypothetical protein